MLTDWSVNTPPPSPPQEGFSGLIERITFHSEETGFAVLRVKVKGHRELVTVVGPCERQRGRVGYCSG
jgi:hypothetical protein